jgi:NAD(P)-dependent dehydrogenase (short-subunit alcohol dehydrogenase family)
MSDNLDLTQRVSLVTGAVHGIGAETAALLVARGATVVLADVDAAVESWRARLAREPTMLLDVSNETLWQKAIAEILARYGQLDILVNNAGIFAPTSIRDTTVEVSSDCSASISWARCSA